MSVQQKLFGAMSTIINAVVSVELAVMVFSFSSSEDFS
jgi:hypothetical protein